MKKFVSLILSFAMVLAMAIPSAAAAEITTENTLTVVDQGYRTLQSNEVISVLTEKCGYSYADALEVANTAATRALTLVERWIHYEIYSYVIEVGCLIYTECGGGHCNFGEIVETWSVAASSGSYTWAPSYVYAEVTGLYADSINFRSRGNIEVTTTPSLAGGFEALGFVAEMVSSSVYICRLPVVINETWTVGDDLP